MLCSLILKIKIILSLTDTDPINQNRNNSLTKWTILTKTKWSHNVLNKKLKILFYILVHTNFIQTYNYFFLLMFNFAKLHSFNQVPLNCKTWLSYNQQTIRPIVKLRQWQDCLGFVEFILKIHSIPSPTQTELHFRHLMMTFS